MLRVEGTLVRSAVWCGVRSETDRAAAAAAGGRGGGATKKVTTGTMTYQKQKFKPFECREHPIPGTMTNSLRWFEKVLPK